MFTVKYGIDVPTARADFPHTASSNAFFALSDTFFVIPKERGVLLFEAFP